jgi:hypothetical protein
MIRRILLSILFSVPLFGSEPTVLVAILARNKAHVLPHFLRCIDELDYDKKKISIYINTNNNEDATQEILAAWVKTHTPDYQAIIFDQHNVSSRDTSKPHEWTSERFKILGAIREKSLKKAQELHTDYYFVVDCDNFITPCTLKELIAKQKPIIAPMLRPIPHEGEPYSNFFCDITDTGYYKEHPDYRAIRYQNRIGTFCVPVVHCTYLIQAPYLDKLRYIDETNDYEFVIFSRSARQNNIAQYICNEKDFGTLLHFQDSPTLAEEAERTRAIFNKPHPISGPLEQ